MVSNPVKRTYIDAGVLIMAFQGQDPAWQRALAVLEDPDRRLVVSDYLRLEVLPQPIYNKRIDEIEFIQAVFERAENVPHSAVDVDNVLDLAVRYGLHAMDSLHVGSALAAGVEEVVTTEKSTKPICRVTEVQVTSLTHHECDTN